MQAEPEEKSNSTDTPQAPEPSAPNADPQATPTAEGSERACEEPVPLRL